MNDLPWLRASRPPCSNSSGNSRGREESRKQSPLQELQQSWKTNFWTNWQPITPLGICHWLHGIWKLRKVTNDKKAAYEARGWLFNDTTLEDLKGEKRSICEDKDITRGWDFARRTWFDKSYFILTTPWYYLIHITLYSICLFAVALSRRSDQTIQKITII